MKIVGICYCIVLGFFWTTWTRSGTVLGQLCEPSRNADTVIRVRNQRNQTGHWISQVSLQNGQAAQDAVAWSLDISYKAPNCPGNKSTNDFIFTFSSQPPKAGPNYELFPDIGYYKFHTDVTTWPRAREICAEEGGHLMIINSEKEAGVLKHLFARYPTINGTPHNDWAWVGYQKPTGSKDWRTIFGNPLNTTGYVKWHPAQPDGKSGEDSLLAYRFTGGLNDVHGSSFNDAFICEQELW